MTAGNKTEITILLDVKEAVQSACPNAKDALLIRVRNGLSVLTRVYGAYTSEDEIENALLLHGKPLLFAESPLSPTMSGMLARGYGREPYDFAAVRDRINAPFTGLADAADRLRPLLSLLEDGWYILADTAQYPTNGESRFFANVPNDMTYALPTVEEMECPDMSNWVKSFPAYLYPSQPNAYLDPERAAYYAEMIESPDAPRAVAYHFDGYISLLLDGHHKAYAAAMRGAAVPCITIIPFSSIMTDCTDRDHIRRFWYFGPVAIPAEKIPDLQLKPRHTVQSLPARKPAANTPVPAEMLQLSRYPDFRALGVYTASVRKKESFPETWTEQAMRNEPERYSLLLEYYAHTEPETGASMAKHVLRQNELPADLQYSAFTVLLGHRSPETEQFFIDYLVTHGRDAACRDIVLSYWDDTDKRME